MESDSVETSSPGPFLGGSPEAWATVSAALVSRPGPAIIIDVSSLSCMQHDHKNNAIPILSGMDSFTYLPLPSVLSWTQGLLRRSSVCPRSSPCCVRVDWAGI